jgi:hypothetical protein
MEKKKAVLVGISNYGGKLPPLESPEREIEEWRDLLMDEYGFSCRDIRLLANDRARRDEIIFRLNWLFSGARRGDQLVFMFAGHALRLTPRDRDTGEILDGMPEAFVAYPSAPTDDLQAMAIYDDYLFQMYVDHRVPNDANVTFVFDCCHAGGFNSRDFPRRPTVMSVTPPVDLRHRSLACASRSNGDSDRSAARSGDTEMPVLVNAAGELNLAVELDLEGERRSLFSYHTLKSLRKNPKLTYRQLLKEIKEPIEQYFPQQQPNLRGNRARFDHQFLN